MDHQHPIGACQRMQGLLRNGPTYIKGFWLCAAVKQEIHLVLILLAREIYRPRVEFTFRVIRSLGGQEGFTPPPSTAFPVAATSAELCPCVRGSL